MRDEAVARRAALGAAREAEPLTDPPVPTEATRLADALTLFGIELRAPRIASGCSMGAVDPINSFGQPSSLTSVAS